MPVAMLWSALTLAAPAPAPAPPADAKPADPPVAVERIDAEEPPAPVSPSSPPLATPEAGSAATRPAAEIQPSESPADLSALEERLSKLEMDNERLRGQLEELQAAHD